jgi:hypothetical protein
VDRSLLAPRGAPRARPRTPRKETDARRCGRDGRPSVVALHAVRRGKTARVVAGTSVAPDSRPSAAGATHASVRPSVPAALCAPPAGGPSRPTRRGVGGGNKSVAADSMSPLSAPRMPHDHLPCQVDGASCAPVLRRPSRTSSDPIALFIHHGHVRLRSAAIQQGLRAANHATLSCVVHHGLWRRGELRHGDQLSRAGSRHASLSAGDALFGTSVRGVSGSVGGGVKKAGHINNHCASVGRARHVGILAQKPSAADDVEQAVGVALCLDAGPALFARRSVPLLLVASRRLLAASRRLLGTHLARGGGGIRSLCVAAGPPKLRRQRRPP